MASSGICVIPTDDVTHYGGKQFVLIILRMYGGGSSLVRNACPDGFTFTACGRLAKNWEAREGYSVPPVVNF